MGCAQAIKEIQREVQKALKERGTEALIENSPVGESQSNGVAENAVKDVQHQIRKLKAQLESQIGESFHQVVPYGHGS